MAFFNVRDNPNAIVYLLLLVLLAVFAGPNVLPNLLSSLIPFVDEGVPCGRLRTGVDRAYYQSLLGRSVSAQRGEGSSPFVISVRTSGAPTSPQDTFTVTITVYNRTLGTVPILITPGSVITDGSAVPGLGIVAGTGNVADLPPGGAVQYQSSQIRLLGPRQRCVHRVQFTGNIPSQFAFAGATLRAYYRNNSVGQASPRVGANQPEVYIDQGLWIGTVLSEVATVPSVSTAPQ